MKMLLQALSILLLFPICVSGSGVIFSGFTEGGTYYTNGDTVTLVTCNATYNGHVITNLTWYYYVSSGGDVDIGNSVLRFEDVVNETVWGDTRLYYCRATYEDNVGVTMSTDSSRITVIVQYDTTITVSCNNTIHVRNQTVRESIPIPVMTENVELRCGVESAEWSYNSLHNQPNPLTLALFTIQFSTDFTCKDNMSREVLSVTLVAVGSGVWQQEGGSYTELAQGLTLEAVVTLTEDVSLVCVTSVLISEISWLFQDKKGIFVRQTDNTEFDSNRGFLTLNLSQSLPANRTGNYYCVGDERDASSGKTLSKTYSIQMVLPTEITTSISTSPLSTTIKTPVITSQSITLPTISTTTPVNTYILITVVGIILLIIMLVSCRIVLSVICICVGIRRKPKRTNKNKAYNQLSVTNTSKKPSQHKTDTSRNRDYMPLQVTSPTTPSSVECATELSEEMYPAVVPQQKYFELDFDDANTEIPGNTSENKYYQIDFGISSDDKLSPNQPPVPLHSLKQFIDTLWSNGMLELRREFDELQLNLMRAPVQVAKLSCNEKLNRDNATLPYDRSRVRLTAAHSSDYVNASLIPGPFSQQTFIAAQLPMHATSGRFWSMVWEQKVSTVLMVSSRDESQHMYRYWPAVGGTQVEGELRVGTVKEEVGEVLVSHKVSLGLCSSPKQVREVLLLEFIGWPENEHCMMSNDVVSCVRSVRNSRGVKGLRGVKTVPSGEKNVSPCPMCVCCVTGCGKTGAIIALYNILECVGSGTSVSVFNCVNGMRNHRPYMVQTLNQYRMLYMALLEIVAGDTRVDIKDAFRSEYMVEREFAELEYQCVKGFERSSCSGVGGKMDSNTPLPYDDTRVLLDSPLHTFYNASYIRSAANGSVNDFIAAVSPRYEEVDQLLQIVFQHKCPLVVALGKHNNHNKLAKYWEVVGGVMSGSFRVRKLSSIEMEGLFICELKLEHVSGESHTFQHIYSDTWSSDGVPSSYSPVLKLLEILLQHVDSANPVMVHCVDGAGVSGVVLAVCLGVNWRRGCEVDLFQACKYLRFHRRRMVSTSEQYRICFEILKRYLRVTMDRNYEDLASIS